MSKLHCNMMRKKQNLRKMNVRHGQFFVERWSKVIQNNGLSLVIMESQQYLYFHHHYFSKMLFKLFITNLQQNISMKNLIKG